MSYEQHRLRLLILLPAVIFDLVSAACTTCEAWKADLGSSTVVAKINECITITASSNEVAYAEAATLWDKYQGNVSECGCDRFCAWFNYLTNYLGDRCIAPRSYCEVTITGAGYGVMANSPASYGAKYAGGADLVAGEYGVMLGAASAYGIGSARQVDQMLDDAGIGPWVNLGRGGFGPRMYLDQWSALEKIIVNAKVVVVQAMALRSSENSWCTYENCTGAAGGQAKREELWGKNVRFRAAMEEESLSNALVEYTQLLESIDNSSCKLGTTPARYLLWLSQCDTATGCEESGNFPQWFTTKERIDRLFAVEGFDATFDANYAHLPIDSPLMPVDKCDVSSPGSVFRSDFGNCAWRDYLNTSGTCFGTGGFRKLANINGCTTTCNAVTQNYYPTEYGQNISFDVLQPVLADLFAPAPPACATCEAWKTDLGSSTVVAKINECITITASSNEVADAEAAALLDQYQGNVAECECGDNCNSVGFLSDRCVVPRAHCAVTIAGAGYGIIAGSPASYGAKYANGTDLVAGEYGVMLGASSALGVMSERQLDQMLDDAGIGPWVNLAREGFGPRQYLDQWPALEKIIVNAKVVVVQAMAGRSSENSACTYENCRGFQHRMNVWKDNPDNQTTMEEESLANALVEYTQLLESIDNSSCKLGTTPSRYLLWNTRCDTATGCKTANLFPQFYTTKERVDRLFAVDGFDATFDANYAHLPGTTFSPPMPVDKCEVTSESYDFGSDFGHCAWRDLFNATTGTCTIKDFHDESEEINGCTIRCSSVTQKYYPSEYGQNISFEILQPVLADLFA